MVMHHLRCRCAAIAFVRGPVARPVALELNEHHAKQV